MAAPQSNSGPRVVRFGVFEADLTAGELRKNGARVRLQDQPFQVLAALLERPLEVVTREELRQKIWPADTFVDFDHSLNTAVNKIREALGDSASSPRYLETLPRKGYRFLAPVQVQTVASEVASPANVAPPSGPAIESPTHAGDLPKAHRGMTRTFFALLQVMYLAFYLTALFRLRFIDLIVDQYSPRFSTLVIALVLISAAVGIPLRCYLLSAVGFDYRRLGQKFRRLYAVVLPVDALWALAPFLLVPEIGLGGAFAATAALLYVPFSERTLIRMAYENPVSSV